MPHLLGMVNVGEVVGEIGMIARRPRTALVRYVVVIVIGLLITAAAVPALTDAGLDYRIAKIVVSLLIGIANYFAFPGWVFRGAA